METKKNQGEKKDDGEDAERSDERNRKKVTNKELRRTSRKEDDEKGAVKKREEEETGSGARGDVDACRGDLSYGTTGGASHRSAANVSQHCDSVSFLICIDSLE